ncbi:F-box domain [Arabidopsis thaliana x Arabidopsis arenosa]|uniref:F-box domain n=1 Tax=Arabidopsis thaliana x Arabidopsis arenosa TaxID=1240361 RepID=A0A8T2C8L1_9BRAS|nr:F-box domain [Arabidopsis thaliana x Arabidopsis arenosa]
MIPEEEVEPPLPQLQHLPCESFSSLPNEIIVNCFARISKMYYPSLSLVSKTFRSLISSPELYTARIQFKTTEICLYVSQQLPIRQCFSLLVNPNLNLTDGRIKEKPRGNLFVPLFNSCLLYSTSTVVVGSELYVIGAPMHDISEPSSVVRVYDFRSDTWRDVPNMKMKRLNAFACLLDDKIYVMGGCTTYYGNSSWFEMFDIKSQTWRNLRMIPDINIRLAYDWRIDAVEGKIYLRDWGKGWIYDVNEGRWIVAESSFTYGWSKYWCVIDDVIYCYSASEYELYEAYRWYDFEARRWKSVNGLEASMKHYTGTSNIGDRNMVGLVNYGGKLAIVWDRIEELGEKKDIWCAVVTMEKCHNEMEIRGKIEWVDVVLTAPKSYEFLRCLAISI